MDVTTGLFEKGSSCTFQTFPLKYTSRWDLYQLIDTIKSLIDG